MARPRTHVDTSNEGRNYTQVTTRITLEGDFFTKDPGKTIRMNIADMLEKLAPEMEKLVRGEISSRAGSMPAYTGWTHDHTFGYVTSFRTRRHWGLWAAVATVTEGMSKKDAIRTKAAAATIEKRFHPFRKMKSAVYRQRAVIAADLTKGLD